MVQLDQEVSLEAKDQGERVGKPAPLAQEGNQGLKGQLVLEVRQDHVEKQVHQVLLVYQVREESLDPKD